MMPIPTTRTAQVGFNVGCAVCHGATVSANRTLLASKANHVNKLLNIRFDNGTLVKDTDLPMYNTTDARSSTANGVTKAPGSAVASCSSVYCHSIGNLDATGNVVTAGGSKLPHGGLERDESDASAATAIAQARPIRSMPAARRGSTTANSHVKHVEGSGLSCDYCHNTTTTNTTIPPTTVVAAGQHLDRTEDVSFKTNGGKTGTYDGVAKTCSTTYCHGTGPSVAWGGATTCASCHGASNNGDLSGVIGATQSGHTIHYGSATAPAAMTDPNGHTVTGLRICLQQLPSHGNPCTGSF